MTPGRRAAGSLTAAGRGASGWRSLIEKECRLAERRSKGLKKKGAPSSQIPAPGQGLLRHLPWLARVFPETALQAPASWGVAPRLSKPPHSPRE